jgi:hypothetical protein
MISVNLTNTNFIDNIIALVYEKGKNMSTKSILKTVVIDKSDTALLLAEALEKSERQDEKRVICNSKCSNLDKNLICSFFGN